MRTRHLVIVESPAKAETIGRFLGDDYLVEASYGHVRDLPRSAEERPASLKGKPWAELAVNVEQDFEPVYIVPPEKSRHVARLREELKRADKLLLATDEDREGESIGWHLVEVLEPTVPVERIVFHEVTRDAIAAAVQAPRQVDLNLVQAQESRRILDRLFGYSLSPLLWRKIQRGLSAGRVQSVAVRLLVQRERERARFHSAVYWDVEAALESAEGADRVSAEGRLDATLRRLGGDRMPTGRDFDPATGDLATPGARVLDEAAVQGLIQAVRQASWTVTKVDARPSAQRPAAPFTTSTLQQEAGNRLGFSAARAMQVAQGLYEGIDVGDERVGLITYMRTDSVTLAQQALGDAQRVIRARFGPEYGGEPRHYRTRTRNAQEAHEAIRPTEFQRTPEELRGSLSDDQYRLYDLIWRRALASQMPDARMERTVVEVSVDAPDGPAVFEARGRRILFPGFLQAYQDRLDEEPLPPVAVGDSVRPRALEAKRHETQPPARYTEASLVRKLEEEGLGRPSTYAAILSTIEDRGYVFKQDSALVPTFVAFAVTTLLERHFMHLVEPRFTAQLEETLDCIARGETDSVSHLREFYHGEDGRPGLQRRIEIEFPQIAFPLYEVGADPESEQPVVVRIGRFGPYLQRGEGGPGDTASIPADLAPADLTIAGALELLAARQDAPRLLGHDPETGLEVLLQSGRFGLYVQLGPDPPAGTRKSERPKRASAPPNAVPEEVTLEDALLWLALPRALGVHPETAEEVVAASGRFGPYVQAGKESRSLGDADDVYSIELPRALELLAAPRAAAFRRRGAARVIGELGPHPKTAAAVRLLEGRYGPYVSDGDTNASLPRGTDPGAVTLEQAVDWIAQRAAAPKRRRGGGKAKATGRKATTRKRGAGGRAARPSDPKT